MSPAREKQNAQRWVEECLIKTPSIGAMCGNLSGGNQQKTVLAKWLSSKVRLLVLDHPTRGVDVGAKAEIYRLMRRLAGEGIAMLHHVRHPGRGHRSLRPDAGHEGQPPGQDP